MTLSYHNSEELKSKAVADAKRHRDQDILIAGTYGKMNGAFRGCSVGCDVFDIKGEIFVDNPHSVTAEYFGFPEWLEHLRDWCFEHLPEGERQDFHVRVKEAIPVGVDLELVRYKIAIRRMDRLLARQTDEKIIKAITDVKACHALALKGGKPDWKKARSAAWMLAEPVYSTLSAARIRRSFAARSAAHSACPSRQTAYSAANAAWSAYWAALRAESVATKQEADALIEELENAAQENRDD